MPATATAEHPSKPGAWAVLLVSLYLLIVWVWLLVTRRLSHREIILFVRSIFQSKEVRAIPYIAAEEGFCFVLPAPEGEISDEEGVSRVELLEDNIPLPLPHTSFHGNIRSLGCGRYSHWGKWIYFSTTDNSSPLRNGRRYTLCCPKS